MSAANPLARSISAREIPVFKKTIDSESATTDQKIARERRNAMVASVAMTILAFGLVCTGGVMMVYGFKAVPLDMTLMVGGARSG